MTFSQRRTVRDRGRNRILAAAVAVTLTGGLLAAVPVATGAADAAGRPSFDLGPQVHGKQAQPAAALAASATARSVQPIANSVAAVKPETVSVPAFAADRHAGTVATAAADGSSAAASTVSTAWVTVPNSTLALAPTQLSTGDNVTISVLSTAAAQSLGGGILAVQLRSAVSDGARVGVRVPDSELTGLVGANGAGRVRWMAYSAAAPNGSSVPASRDSSAHTTVLSPTISKSQTTTLVARATATDAAGTGSFAATPLKPAASWDVSTQTGSFSWSLPMTTPAPAGGPTPSVSLAYSSQSVDGETGSTNNQPSVVGDGWSLAAGGFIERSYASCATDDGKTGAVTTSGDLCWGRDNASLSLQGHAGDLVKDTTTGTWKSESDDGSRIQYLTGAANGSSDGGYWVVTTLDGTKYFFGRNATPTGGVTPNSAWTVPVFGNDPGEPGYNGDGTHAGTFASEAKTQVWRWNLDYVLDTHGNAESLTYAAETNQYRQNNTTAVTYTRGGTLRRIDYGLRDATATAASDSVVFAYGNRCTSTTACDPVANRANWPDTPQDQACADGTCTSKLSPTFWTTQALATVTTSVKVGGVDTTVNQWGLDHTYPDPGDGTSAALWLNDVTHTGYGSGTSLATPTTTFSGSTLQNRVWAVDGLAPLDKYRVNSIATADGAVISVNYSAQECTPSDVATITANPQTNTKRCFPQWWEPNVTPPQASKQDLFHIYVVTTVVTDPHTGGQQDFTETDSYLYGGTPGWRYASLSLSPAKDRTWSDYVGYSNVEVRRGDPHTPAQEADTQYWFYQGLDGDRAAPSGGVRSATVSAPDAAAVTDSRWLQGSTLESKTFNGVGGAALTWTVSTPWASAATASNTIVTARLTGDGTTQTSAPLSVGGNRVATTVTTHDATYGLVTSVSSTASDKAAADSRATCTTTSYNPNVSSTAYLVDFPSEVKTVTGTCGASNPTGLNDVRNFYDTTATTWPTTPTAGNLTRVQQATAYNPTAPSTPSAWRTSTSSFDALGRATQTVDAIGRTTTTAFTPATSGPVTQVGTTNAANWSTTTVLDPALGVPTSVTDANNHVTSAAYDALGRITSVWLPDNPRSANPPVPSRSYGYRLSNTVTNAVAESDYITESSVKTTFKLYDGLDRLIQTQTPADTGNGGATVTDVGYNATGNVFLQNNPYWTTDFTPSYVSGNTAPTLYVPTEQQIPSQQTTQYDGAQRPTTTTLWTFNTQYSTTATSYPGVDRVDVNPPAGTVPTSTFTDAHGLAAKLTQYLSTSVSTTAATETTNYQHDARGNLTQQTDPANHVWSWAYDALGRPITAVDPDTGTTTTAYDDADRPISATDGTNVTTSYAYQDALGRKTSTWLGAVNTGTELASWAYNSTTAKGDLDSSTSYDNGLAYTQKYLSYDAADHLTAAEWSIPTGPAGILANPSAPDQYRTTATYFLGGQLFQQSHTTNVGGLGAELNSNGYDPYGNYVGLSIGGSTAYYAGNYVYRGDGKLAGLEHHASYDDFTGYAYDSATGAVTGINDTVGSGANQVTVANQTVTRDTSGNVTKTSTTATNVATDTQCFTYDQLVQLTAAWTPANGDCTATPTAASQGGPAPYWTTWTNDPATGDRTKAVRNAVTGGASATTTDTYSYAAPNSVHAVSQVSHASGSTTTTDAYSYNKDGQTIARPGLTSLTWTAGHLNNATSTAGTQHNVYDADGNLLLRTDPTQGITLYLGSDELHVAPGSSTIDGTRTYTANGTQVANRVASTANTTTTYLYWLVDDNNGTPIAQVWSKTGAITRRYSDPYGNSRGAAAPWATSHTFLNAPTSVFDSLVHLQAREYDSRTGQFISVDPIMNPSSPAQGNGYSYSHWNPVTFSDSSGLMLAAGDGGGGPNPAPTQCGLWCVVSGAVGNQPSAAIHKPPVIPGARHPVPATGSNATSGQKPWLDGYMAALGGPPGTTVGAGIGVPSPDGNAPIPGASGSLTLRMIALNKELLQGLNPPQLRALLGSNFDPRTDDIGPSKGGRMGPGWRLIHNGRDGNIAIRWSPGSPRSDHPDGPYWRISGDQYGLKNELVEPAGSWDDRGPEFGGPIVEAPDAGGDQPLPPDTSVQDLENLFEDPTDFLE